MSQSQNTLIVFTGLPGSGKSSLAEATGRILGIPVFAKDWLEGVLTQCGVESAIDSSGQRQPLGYIGYEMLTSLATRQLHLGQSVILDSVASTQSIRDRWKQIAHVYRARWRVVECVCSDETIHQQRLLDRQRGIPGWHELSWEDVERIRSYYAPWEDARLKADSTQPFESNLQAVLTYLAEM